MNKHVAKQYVVAPGLEARLERVAERLQRSTDQVLESALVDYLDRIETREQLYEELDRRHERYQQTGLHLTNEEVRQWLLQRARGERVPRPKAHT